MKYINKKTMAVIDVPSQISGESWELVETPSPVATANSEKSAEAPKRRKRKEE